MFKPRRVMMVADEEDDFGMNTSGSEPAQQQPPLSPELLSQTQQYSRHQNFFRSEERQGEEHQQQQQELHQQQTRSSTSHRVSNSGRNSDHLPNNNSPTEEEAYDDAYLSRVRPTTVPLDYANTTTVMGNTMHSGGSQGNQQQQQQMWSPGGPPKRAAATASLVVEVGGKVLVDSYGIDLGVFHDVSDLEATYLGLKEVTDKLHLKLTGYLPQKYSLDSPSTTLATPLCDSVVNTARTSSSSKTSAPIKFARKRVAGVTNAETQPQTSQQQQHDVEVSVSKPKVKKHKPAPEEVLPTFTSDDIPATQAELMEVDPSMLKAMCKSMRLPFSGTRRQLMERLGSFKAANPTKTEEQLSARVASQSLDDFLVPEYEEEADGRKIIIEKNKQRVSVAHNNNNNNAAAAAAEHQTHPSRDSGANNLNPRGSIEQQQQQQQQRHSHQGNYRSSGSSHQDYEDYQSPTAYQRNSKLTRFSTVSNTSYGLDGERMREESSRTHSLQSHIIPSQATSTAGSIEPTTSCREYSSNQNQTQQQQQQQKCRHRQKKNQQFTAVNNTEDDDDLDLLLGNVEDSKEGAEERYGGGVRVQQPNHNQYSTPVSTAVNPRSRKSYVCPSSTMLLSDSDDEDEPVQQQQQQQQSFRQQSHSGGQRHTVQQQQQQYGQSQPQSRRASSVFISTGEEEDDDEEILDSEEEDEELIHRRHGHPSAAIRKGDSHAVALNGHNNRRSGQQSNAQQLHTRQEQENELLHRRSSQLPRGSMPSTPTASAPAVSRMLQGDDGDNAYLYQQEQVRELASQGRASNGQRLSRRSGTNPNEVLENLSTERGGEEEEATPAPAASRNTTGNESGVGGFFRRVSCYIPGMSTPQK